MRFYLVVLCAILSVQVSAQKTTKSARQSKATAKQKTNSGKRVQLFNGKDLTIENKSVLKLIQY